MTRWFDETLHDHYRQSLSVNEMFYDSETEHQRIQVFRNGTFGRIMTLDGVVQTTEGDNFIYHEMMAHVPILAHGAARRVLIIGGGDGGMARAALAHKTVEHVTMVEIDGGVVAFCKQYMPTLSAGAFDDARLDLVIADGADFMRQTADDPANRFDVIIIDSTDPIGPGEVLFTDTFYGHAARCLTADGILTTQNGVPFMQGDELTQTMRAFKALFSDARCYLASVPTYAGGPMALGWGTNGPGGSVDLETLTGRFEAAGIVTHYYNPATHLAAFALPEYVRKLLP